MVRSLKIYRSNLSHVVLVVTQQLNDGVRLLQVQAHNLSGAIQLCHTTCVCRMLTRRLLVRINFMFYYSRCSMVVRSKPI